MTIIINLCPNSGVQAYILLCYEVQYLNEMWTEQMADILLKNHFDSNFTEVSS